ncbi:MAG: hypothetical protein FWH21_06035 [Kiritimatiellaeota bacterium]|nr:hypothetical protein [Kiritimatiellota bacterium]
MLNGLFLGSAVARQMQVAEAQMQANLLSGAVSEARLNGEKLQADVDKLFLLAQALWELLKTEHGYTDELLIKKITEIDLLDGRLDGKVAKKERPDCPSCGKKMGRTPACIWCGTLVPRDPFER